MNRGIVARAVGLCLAGTSILLFSTAALAAPAPDGSYQQSCRNYTASRGTLTGECQSRSGAWRSSSLDDYRNCSGDISNNDGTLTCARGSSNTGANSDDQPRTGDRWGRDRDDNDANDNGNDNDRTVRAPLGSYRDSCRNVRIDGDDLVAECRNRDGDWHRTTLNDYRRCGDEISNDDGRLRCDRGGDRGDRSGDRDNDRMGGPGWQPRGSYQDSCRRIRFDDGDLSAYCRTRSGDWRQTDLENARQCRGDIANDNGRLVCDRGDRRSRITLFQHARYAGRSRTYGDDQPTLGDFSDMASSAYVQGGRWQLCTQRYYRGRCVVLDANVLNFTILGINDRVESLRRVR
jgi:hypothetical protein